MKDYKVEFIEFLIKNQALKFGEFKLKSGRLSPYFLNTGSLYNGESINKLGIFYAATIVDNIKDNYNVIFGPAYKGIPLAITTLNALYKEHNINVNYSFNRKEGKDHGDKGILVGKKLTSDDNLILVDDVITAGTAIKESIEVLKSEGNSKIRAVVISVDRMEKGAGNKSAIQELNESTGIKFYPIVNIIEIITYLKNNGVLNSEQLEKMYEYREKYGV